MNVVNKIIKMIFKYTSKENYLNELDLFLKYYESRWNPIKINYSEYLANMFNRRISTLKDSKYCLKYCLKYTPFGIIDQSHAFCTVKNKQEHGKQLILCLNARGIYIIKFFEFKHKKYGEELMYKSN